MVDFMEPSTSDMSVKLAAHEIGTKLIAKLFCNEGQNALLQLLVAELHKRFSFDRLCINLYNAEYGVISQFYEAGTVVTGFPSVRHLRGSISELVITARNSVCVQNIQSQLGVNPPYPMVEVGLNATVATPLLLGEEIIGTVHCSFKSPQEDMMQVLGVLAGLSPVLSMCLHVLLHCGDKRALIVQDSLSPSESVEPEMIETPDMQHLVSHIQRIAQLELPVLICGETGTGKSKLARYIHEHSTRRAGPFVKVNCPSLAASLFESEFFGHARGAFTGAREKRIGRVELAQHGTLFLDEIGELSTEIQSKLLQTLEDRTFERVGESSPISLDVRLIAATNLDIKTSLANQKLRRDLYYRLAAVIITMPPLRERRNDIPLLAEFLIRQQVKENGLPHVSLKRKSMQVLQDYAWPGNIRELRNFTNRLLVYSKQSEPAAEKVAEILHIDNPEFMEVSGTAQGRLNSAELAFHESTRQNILEVLRASKGKISGTKGAAARLGIPRSTLLYRMRNLGIET